MGQITFVLYFNIFTLEFSSFSFMKHGTYYVSNTIYYVSIFGGTAIDPNDLKLLCCQGNIILRYGR